MTKTRENASIARQRQCGTLERNNEIAERASGGESFASIARDLGMSADRIAQIVHRARILREKGGLHDKTRTAGPDDSDTRPIV